MHCTDANTATVEMPSRNSDVIPVTDCPTPSPNPTRPAAQRNILHRHSQWLQKQHHINLFECRISNARFYAVLYEKLFLYYETIHFCVIGKC